MTSSPSRWSPAARATARSRSTAANAHYVPAAGYTGPDSFQFVADDGQAQSAPATVNITVVPAGGGGGAVVASIGNVSTSEASNQIVFTLGLSGVANGAKVKVSTADDTARAGEDYLAYNTEFTFNSGETSHDVIVKLTDDTIDENDEQFRVVMEVTSPAGGPAVVAGAAAIGTITDNDAAPSLVRDLVPSPTKATRRATSSPSRSSCPHGAGRP